MDIALGDLRGQNDVKNSPNSYSLFTAAQYNTYGSQCYNNGYNAGVSTGSSSVQNIIISARNDYVSIYLPSINGFTYSGSNSDGYFFDDGYKGIMSNGYYNSASFSGYTWISFGGSPQITVVPKGK